MRWKAANEEIFLAKGERIFIEQSRKFHVADIAELAQKAGLTVSHYWESKQSDYFIAEII